MTLATAYHFLLLASALIAGAIATAAWQRRRSPEAAPLIVLMLCEMWWSGFYLLYLVSPIQTDPLFWLKCLFLGIVIIPVAHLGFALQYTGQGRWLTRRTFALLAIHPVLATLAVWTDGYHGLFFGAELARDAPFVGGPAFWLHIVYSYVLLSIAWLLLGRAALYGPPLQRKQTAAVLLGALVAAAANIATIFHLSPLPVLDLTPVGFTIEGLIIAAALFRRGLLDVVPVAREAVVERMSDGVIVLDAQDRVVDLNPAAQRMLQLPTATVLGKRLSTVWGPQCQYISRYRDVFDAQDELRIKQAGGDCYLDLRIAALRDQHGRPNGRLIVLRDVTRLKRAEAELREQLANNQLLQAQLQEQVIRDPLTGLYNRRFLEETLAREVAQAVRAQGQLSIALIDVDNFKQVNDRYGHATGDRILQALSALLLAQSRGGDAICRFGGEEFVALMPGATAEVAQQRVDRWRQAFAASSLPVGEFDLRATFSAGVAAFPSHGAGAAGLLKAADLALYSAKAAGRNCVMSPDEPAARPLH